jgi:hypothetical protein
MRESEPSNMSVPVMRSAAVVLVSTVTGERADV